MIRDEVSIGQEVRPRPSGHVHAVEYVDAYGVPWVLMRCGKKFAAHQLTADFPTRASRCPVCFGLSLWSGIARCRADGRPSRYRTRNTAPLREQRAKWVREVVQ